MARPSTDPLNRARELSLAGLLGALGLLIPVIFHAVGWGGPVFLPMHLPVVVAGFVVGPVTAAAVGLVVPLLSALLTGMPPLAPPIAPLMSLELAAKAGAASLLYRKLRLPLWIALAGAILANWLVLAAAALLAARAFGISKPPIAYVLGVVVLSWPGTLLQLIGVPLAVAAIERRVPRLARERKESQPRSDLPGSG